MSFSNQAAFEGATFRCNTQYLLPFLVKDAVNPKVKEMYEEMELFGERGYAPSMLIPKKDFKVGYLEELAKAGITCYVKYQNDDILFECLMFTRSGEPSQIVEEKWFINLTEKE